MQGRLFRCTSPINGRHVMFYTIVTCYFTRAQNEQGSSRIFLLVVQNSWNGSGITPASLPSTFIIIEKSKCCCKEQAIGNNPRYWKQWSHNISKSLCCLFKLWSLYWHILPSAVWTTILRNAQPHPVLGLLSKAIYQPWAVWIHHIPAYVLSWYPSAPKERELTAENRNFSATLNGSFFIPGIWRQAESSPYCVYMPYEGGSHFFLKIFW